MKKADRELDFVFIEVIFCFAAINGISIKPTTKVHTNGLKEMETKVPKFSEISAGDPEAAAGDTNCTNCHKF